MSMNTTLLPAGNPFVALRRDFERQLGVENEFLLAAMSIEESADDFLVKLDLPGVQESDISITLHNDELVIEGRRQQPEREGAIRTFCDRAFAGFRRVLKLREPIDREAIEADLQNGVLQLRLPRLAETKPRKIQIRMS